MVYIPGEANSVADALSRIPEGAFAGEDHSSPPHTVWGSTCAAVLSIATDTSVLEEIKAGYLQDEFCIKLASKNLSVPGVRKSNDLWYVGNRLVIPRTGALRENLFRLAHDTAGHFGASKSYATLRDAYYWPNMRRDLTEAYVPSCTECQRNKSPTSSKPGPLHPLPIPDKRGDSVALDFVGPLPEDEGFNCLLTMTDRLGGADIRIVPTRTNISAEDLAVLFFDHWYCENGLPLELILDRDKLFTSKFWKSLHALTGVRLKMSTSYHPETDGSSERTNKTLNQAIRYHVHRNQKGWVKALPRIQFNIMSTINASTGYSPFQLRLGQYVTLPHTSLGTPTKVPDSL
jgi:hypothetical protein